MQRGLESAMAELVLGPGFDPDDDASAADFAERHALSPKDAASFRGAHGRRLLVYRELVRATLGDAVELAIPRSIARLGAVFDEYFTEFLATRGPQSHYLRDVTREFLSFCAPRWAADDRVPAYVPALAELEALHIEIAAAPPREEPIALGVLSLESRFHFSEAMRLVHFAHSVHELSEELADRSVPAARDTWLLVYRSADHNVRYLELTRLAAAIVARLFEGANLRDGLLDAVREAGRTLDAATLDGTAALLADLAERGVVLGPRTVDEPRAAAPNVSTLEPSRREAGHSEP